MTGNVIASVARGLPFQDVTREVKMMGKELSDHGKAIETANAILSAQKDITSRRRTIAVMDFCMGQQKRVAELETQAENLRQEIDELRRQIAEFLPVENFQ